MRPAAPRTAPNRPAPAMCNEPAPPTKGETMGPAPVPLGGMPPVVVPVGTGVVSFPGIGYGVATTTLAVGSNTEEEEAVGATTETVGTGVWGVGGDVVAETPKSGGRVTPFCVAHDSGERP